MARSPRESAPAGRDRDCFSEPGAETRVGYVPALDARDRDRVPIAAR